MKYLIVICTVFLLSCSQSATQPDFDREQYLKDMSQYYIEPGMLEFTTQAALLETAAQSLCSNKTQESLEQAQNTWKTTFLAYKKLEMLSFGYPKEQRWIYALNTWPTQTNTLESTIQNQSESNLEHIENFAENIRGLSGLEYLLFNNTDTLSDSKRCTTARSMAQHIRAMADQFSSVWQSNNETLGKGFVEGTAPFDSVQDAIDDLLNGVLELVGDIEDMKLAKPLGLRDGNVIQPTFAEAPYAHYSKEALLANIHAIGSFYEGTGWGISIEGDSIGVSLKDYVRTRSIDLNERIIQAIIDLKQAVQDISAPIETAVTSQPERVQAAFDAAKNLQQLLKTELATQLGATVTFSSNDGD